MAEQAHSSQRKLRILTWHVHGNYLYALTQVPHEFVIPVKPGNPPGYSAIGSKIPWGANVVQVPAEQLREQRLDGIVYQSCATYEDDRQVLLSPEQLALPSVYIEHNPPEPHAVATRHPFRHDKGVVVHVTHYNALYWDNGDMPVKVIEHGLVAPAAIYRGDKAAGIAVVNHLAVRGRAVGADLFEAARTRVALELIGMDSERSGGLGEISNMEVAPFIAAYRYFFTPVRYGSLALALVEAMLVGLPVVGIAGTELPQVIRNGENGFVHTDFAKVVEVMRQLAHEPELARAWGDAARRDAMKLFNIERFIQDWLGIFASWKGDMR
jgi:glycosyltransferase involved in cell wall biosynthesis